MNIKMRAGVLYSTTDQGTFLILSYTQFSLMSLSRTMQNCKCVYKLKFNVIKLSESIKRKLTTASFILNQL